MEATAEDLSPREERTPASEPLRAVQGPAATPGPRPDIGKCQRCGVIIIVDHGWALNAQKQPICLLDVACANRHLANIIWLVTGATLKQINTEVEAERRADAVPDNAGEKAVGPKASTPSGIIVPR